MDHNPQSLWKQTLDLIHKSHVFEEEIYSWLLKSDLFRLTDGQAYVCYGSLITMSVLKDNLALFEDTLSELVGSPVHIDLVSAKEKENLMPETIVQNKANELLEYQFNDSYTFESFVEGSSNQEAYAATLAVCTQNSASPRMYNPLMLYGNSGLGKTHLLHAAGNYLHAEKPEARVIYMYAGDFVTLLIEAMKTKNVHGNTVERVKEKLLDCDYFLIDDIQNLKNSSSQEIFFTVYNKLIEQNTQIILTSDIHPTELEGLQARLLSRFASGLAINISKPTFDTSKAILRKKIEGQDNVCNITDEAIDYLALRCSRDVRDLEGSLNRLLFNSLLCKPEVIDVEFAMQVLQADPVPVSPQGELTFKDIKKTVSGYYGLSYKDLEGKSRQKKIAMARHICVFLARDMLHAPYTTIGAQLGNRDHKTISSSYERAKKLIETDASFSEAVDILKGRLAQ